MNRQLCCILLFATLSIIGNAQNCKSVSKKVDREDGIITISGIVSSKDFYSLLIQKQLSYDDTTISPKYILFLNVASRVQFSDSTLKTKGTFHFKLLDSSMVTLNDVSLFNRPLGMPSLGFKVYVNEAMVRSLAANPIVTLYVDDKLKTDFKPKTQKQQQQIFSCLLQKNPR